MENNQTHNAVFIAQYIHLGWSLVPIPKGQKGPTYDNWNIRTEQPFPLDWDGNLGLKHAYSLTMAFDVDDEVLTRGYLHNERINYDALLNAPDAVQIQSGKPGHAKLIYRMPVWCDTMRTRKVNIDGRCAFELRNATKSGSTVQDVLPPSIHPETGQPYQWVGDFTKIPEIPPELLQLWLDLTTPKVRTGSGTVNVQLDQVADALKHIDPDLPRDEWIKIGMAIHSVDPYAVDLFDQWSARGSKYVGHDINSVWDSFDQDDDGVTVGTLFHYAKAAGWPGYTPDLGLIFGEPGTPAPESDVRPRAKSLQEVLQHFATQYMLGDLNTDTPTEEWSFVIYNADLSNTDIDQIIEKLVKYGLGGKRALHRDWIYFRDKANNELRHKQHQQHIKQQRGARATIQLGPGMLNDNLAQTEEAMLTNPGTRPLMRMSRNLYTRVELVEPEHMHAIEGHAVKPPITPLLIPYNKDEMAQRINASAFFVRTKDGRMQPVNPPSEIVNGMLSNMNPNAPQIRGLINHPIILPDGRYLDQPGLDSESGIYVHSEQVLDVPEKPTKEDAKKALNFISQSLFSEFSFADSALDGVAAMALLLTALVRRILSQAPGYLANAHTQGSGKTTLMRMIYIILVGKDMPVFTMEDDQTEMKKAVFSFLLRQVEMVCFDNIPDGFVLKSPTLASMITSSEYTGRVLGLSRDATVPTNVLWAFTGNNISLCPDLVRRIIQIKMDPQVERPEQRNFINPDVVAYTLSIRDDVLRAAMTALRAYASAGFPDQELPRSGMPQWDRLVRAPLVWCGWPDVGEKFDQNRDESPELQGQKALLSALADVFGADQRFRPAEVIRAIKHLELVNTCDSSRDPEQVAKRQLHDIVAENYPKALQSAKSLGWVLRKLLGRNIGGMKLKVSGKDSATPQYWVHKE